MALLSGGVAFVSGLIGFFFSLGEGRQEVQHERTRPARIVQQLGAAPVDTQTGAPVYSLGPFPTCTEASDIRRPGRHFTIITTAALPWRTGPAVNALLRALYLAKSGRPVRLMLPWIERSEQEKLFDGWEVFEERASQEEYIRRWCAEHAQEDIERLPLQLHWYEACYVEQVRSIFPKGDCSTALGDGPRDVLILEEPEHLCWYHNGQRWPELFQHVIGIVHTNYQAYLEKMGYEGLLSTPEVRDGIFLTFTSMVCSAYCDVTIKLSTAGVSLPNEVCSDIHGVRNEFFEIGKAVPDVSRGSSRSSSSSSKSSPSDSEPVQAYFLGKAVFQKGWGELLDYLKAGSSRCADVCIDGFGSGPDLEAIRKGAEEVRSTGGAQLQVFEGLDHSDPRIHEFSVLVNPSTSEMLCTVTAEALAMCKRVVLPRHPSNLFFTENFPDRCHLFEPGKVASFEGAVREALAAGRPPPLSHEMEQLLSWESAIERLCDAVEVRVLSGSYQRPSAVASARLAYDLHRRIQTESPTLSNLLKSATLKEKSPTPWEDYMIKWQESESGKFIMDQMERFRTL